MSSWLNIEGKSCAVMFLVIHAIIKQTFKNTMNAIKAIKNIMKNTPLVLYHNQSFEADTFYQELQVH